MVPLVYLGLAIAVAGPLLAPGYVLFLDIAQTPHPGIPMAYWGLGEGTHEGPPSRLPLDVFFAALGEVDAVQVGQKLMLVAIIFLAGWGMHRLVRTHLTAAAFFAGFLYAVNPFVYDRLHTGQWFLLLGYALLPHAYRAFRSMLEGGRWAPWQFGALFVATGISSVHMAVLLLVLCATTLAAWGPTIRRRPRIARRVAAGFALAAAPSLYWLLPTPGLREFWQQVGPEQLALYRTVADQQWGLVPAVAGLSGFWNAEIPIQIYSPIWPMIIVIMVALAVWGSWLRRADPTTWAVVAAGIFGALLALGDASWLTRGAFTFLLDQFAAVRSFREPQKGVALVAFAYAFLGAPAVDEILRQPLKRRWAKPALTALILVFPLMTAFRLIGGADLRVSHFPRSWEQANSILKREARTSRTLFLPWHGYFPLDFAHEEVVGNLAPSFFETPMLASRSVANEPGLSNTPDPVDPYVKRLLDTGYRLPLFAACLAPLGVAHILLAKESDWRRYRFLDRRKDVVAVRRWPNLVLYRLRAPAGLIMSAPGRRRACSDGLRPLAFRKLSPVRYRIASPPPADRLVVGLPRSDDWALAGNELRFRPWGVYRRNYILGLAGALVFLLSLPLARRRRR